MTMIRRILMTCCLAAPILAWLVPAHALDDHTNSRSGDNRTLLIVIDGLRPDYITEELMPNLHGVGSRGVLGQAHHAAYPTVTRVNSSSISTGSHPARHGIIHNILYLPEVSDEPISTGSARNLQRIAEAFDGELLTATTLGEVLDEHGRRIWVTGSGGSGGAFLLNPRVKGAGIWNRSIILPEEAREEVEQTIGPPPPGQDDFIGDRNRWTTWSVDAYLHQAQSDNPPDVSVMWITDPDGAGHRFGVGASETIQALENVDRQIGRILDAHDEHGLADRVNIFVTTDHGFSTFTGESTIHHLLREHDLLDNVTVAGRAMIFLDRDDPERLEEIVRLLQRTEWVGTIFTRPVRPGSSEGIVPGTFSFNLINWNHERSADILVEPQWSDEPNERGYAGTTTYRGTAGHGSASPFDIQVTLVAAGPDIKTGLRSNVPSGNIDLAPTILHLHGIDSPDMDGRILHEILRDGPDPGEVQVHKTTHTLRAPLPDGNVYQARVNTARVENTIYLRSAAVHRQSEE
jgi:predicted AlkP superfamily pyrophosphatase or phosphodiesterase